MAAIVSTGRSIRTWALAMVLGVFPLETVAAEVIPPQQVIEEVSARLQRVLRDDSQRLADEPAYGYRLVDEVLLPHVDMTRVSSLILGRYWRQATPSERQGFAREFKRMLVRTYATALHELGAWEIRFPASRSHPGDTQVLVQTQVIRAGAQPVAVDYRMYLKEDRWLAYDVLIEGMSLITNYRSSFARLIQSKGIGGLIQELARTNDEKERPAPDKLALGADRG